MTGSLPQFAIVALLHFVCMLSYKSRKKRRPCQGAERRYHWAEGGKGNNLARSALSPPGPGSLNSRRREGEPPTTAVGSERPENCPVDSFQRRTGEAPEGISSAVRSPEREQAPQWGVATIEGAEIPERRRGQQADYTIGDELLWPGRKKGCRGKRKPPHDYSGNPSQCAEVSLSPDEESVTYAKGDVRMTVLPQLLRHIPTYSSGSSSSHRSVLLSQSVIPA